MNHLMRMEQATVAEIAKAMHIDIDEALEILDTLVARGHLKQSGEGPESTYDPILGRSRRPRLSSSLWTMLEEEE
jgi:DNA-binding IclR family transcriptional regulator